jgi:hypothetical protein
MPIIGSFGAGSGRGFGQGGKSIPAFYLCIRWNNYYKLEIIKFILLHSDGTFTVSAGKGNQ